MEALTFIDLVNQHIIPAVKSAGVGPLSELQTAVVTIKTALKEIHHTSDNIAKANLARTLRLDTLTEIRKHTDDAEEVVPANLWTLPTYKDLLFLDQNHGY